MRCAITARDTGAPGALVVLVAAVAFAATSSVVAACAGGDDEASTAVSTAVTAPAPTTTTTVATTTTLSEEEIARRAIEAFTSEQEAQFKIFADPPRFPGPLPVRVGPVEPYSDPLPVLRAAPDATPVFDEAGDEIFVGVRFDGLGRLLAAEDGRLLDDGGGEIPRDAQGPIILEVRFGDDGLPVREDPPPVPAAPPPPVDGAVPPPPPPAPEPGPVVYERRAMLAPDRVLALGDSVLLGTQGSLPPALGGWTTLLDARESRLPGHGAEILRTRPDLGRVVIIMLGHNVGPGESYRVYLDGLQAAIYARGVVDRVVWVTAAEISEAQLGYNEALRAFVAERRAAGDTEAHLLDWALFNAANPQYSDDGLHLTGEGRGELSRLLARFVGPPPGDCAVVIGAGPRAGECA
jgi:hypothetical protein